MVKKFELGMNGHASSLQMALIVHQMVSRMLSGLALIGLF